MQATFLLGKHSGPAQVASCGGSKYQQMCKELDAAVIEMLCGDFYLVASKKITLKGD